MKKSTVLTILGVIALISAVFVVTRSLAAARSYQNCVTRVLAAAPPTDASPPAAFRRLQPEIWRKRDLYLARVLARECNSGPRDGVDKARQELFALGVVKSSLSPSLKESLAATLLPAHEGRGITQSAQMEWGHPPAALDDSEMTWLFVVGQRPTCSNRLTLADGERKACREIFERWSAVVGQPPGGAHPPGGSS